MDKNECFAYLRDHFWFKKEFCTLDMQYVQSPYAQVFHTTNDIEYIIYILHSLYTTYNAQ